MCCRKELFSLMERIKLCEGIHLNIIPSEKFKTNYMSVCFTVPLEKTSAHLTALVPKILMRGCEKYKDMASISERLEYLYASEIAPIYVKRAQNLVVGFSADFIKDSFVPDGKGLLKEVTGLLFDILLNPLTVDGVFREDYTESEKADLINAINAKINNKAAYAKDKCTEIMFGARPYALNELGTPEDVRAATPKQVFERYRYILKTAPVEIFFSGECDKNELADIITKRFPMSDKRLVSLPCAEVLDGLPDDITEVTEEMPVAQGKLVMGYRMGGININSEDSAAFTVFNEIFGGSPSSKLFMNVREAMSLCYYCRSMPDMFMSAMFVSSGIENSNKDLAFDAINEQLEAIKNGDFTLEDIEDAKRSISNAYRELDDSSSSLCLWYMSRIIMNNSLTPAKMLQKISEVTKEQIIDAANKVALDTVFFLKGTGNGGDVQ